MNSFVRVETLITALEVSQGQIQPNIHNFQNHKGYFLSYCVKSVTADLDT